MFFPHVQISDWSNGWFSAARPPSRPPSRPRFHMHLVETDCGGKRPNDATRSLQGFLTLVEQRTMESVELKTCHVAENRRFQFRHGSNSEVVRVVVGHNYRSRNGGSLASDPIHRRGSKALSKTLIHMTRIISLPCILILSQSLRRKSKRDQVESPGPRRRRSRINQQVKIWKSDGDD